MTNALRCYALALSIVVSPTPRPDADARTSEEPPPIYLASFPLPPPPKVYTDIYGLAVCLRHGIGNLGLGRGRGRMRNLYHDHHINHSAGEKSIGYIPSVFICEQEVIYSVLELCCRGKCLIEYEHFESRCKE